MASTISRMESMEGVPMAIVRQLTHLDEARGREAMHRAQKPDVLANLQTIARIQSSEASSAIEGITAPAARIRALMSEKTRPRNRSEAEIAGYRSALDLVHSSAEHMPFTASVAQQLHQRMMQLTGTPGGKFKQTDNQIEEQLPDGSRVIRFVPVPAWQTPDAMRMLHEAYDNARGRDVLHPALLLASYVLDFTCIHPFTDGNGRMSRLMTLLGLYHGQYGVGRFVSVERVIADTRESYYESLGASSAGWHDDTHDPLPWVSYFVGVLIVVYQRFEELVGVVASRRGAKAEAIETFIRTRAVPVFSVADIREAVPTASDATIRKVLHQLRDAGVIESTGTGRAAKWRREPGD